MQDCPSKVADLVVAAGGPRPDYVYRFAYESSLERDGEGCANFFRVYTNSGFDPHVGREDELGDGTHWAGVIPVRVSAATSGREVVAALLKRSTNIFVGFVLENEDNSQEIVHILDDWDENPENGWCVACGEVLGDEYEVYSDGRSTWKFHDECYYKEGYEHCGYCGSDFTPDEAGKMIDTPEGWICEWCAKERHPDVYARWRDQWEDLDEDEADELHAQALDDPEWLHVKQRAAGQERMSL